MVTLLGIAAMLTSACTAFTPPDKTQLTSTLCSDERPRPRKYTPEEAGPSGLLSPGQAVERAKQAAEEELLEFEGASLRFDPCDTGVQTLVDMTEPTPHPVWKVSMWGSFEHDGICEAGWRITLDARTGHDLEARVLSRIKGEADCSTAL